MASVLPFNRPIRLQRTPAQEKFWSLFQNEENRTLTPSQLCRKAGYKSTTAWYTALRDDAFRSSVEALGITTYREHHAKSIRGVVPLTATPNEDWSKDIIDLRRFVGDYPKHMPASTYRLNFSFISNAQLKSLVKRYFRAHLNFWGLGSFRQYLRYLQPFLRNLGDTYPQIESFAPLTRQMIEPLLTASSWRDVKGRQHSISTHVKGHMIGVLNGMFTYMQRHEWEGAPLHALIYDEDRPKLSRKRPRPLPESVLEQLLVHVHLLHPYARNLVEILSAVGLRAVDALHLTEDCLEVDATGDPRLHWYNHKMKRDGRPLPVTDAVASAIKRQQELVSTIPDLFGKRYLFRTPRGLYQFPRFCDHLNEVAQQARILGPDGQIYHFKPHQFRHTVGTQMINHGMGIADVMAYLDHQSPEMTLRYTEIDDDKLKQKFKQLVLAGQAAGGVALKVLKEQLEKGDERELDWVVSNLRRLSLPWGYCLHHAKANKCPYGQNRCFTKDNGPCHKLVTTPEHAPVIVATLQDLQRSRRVAEEQGWQMYANDLDDQIAGMEQVLAELNRPEEHRPKNRGGKQ